MAKSASAIILFAHGARDPQWAEPFKEIQKRVKAQLKDTKVELAFLELMQPTLEDAVKNLTAQEINQITIIPLFLAQGGHLKEDLPKLLNDIRKKNPQIVFHIASALGEAEEILESICGWVLEEYKNKKT
jgi:sirohydrochlorin cobaltochelatase